jgi:hypothetical protein
LLLLKPSKQGCAMWSDGNQSSASRARRHFLGVATATGAKFVAVGILASSVFSGTSALAKGKGKGGGKGGKGGKGGACFLPGTLISTPKGEVRIEELRIGDRVQTIRGGAMEIKWIGRRVFGRDGAARNLDIMPICIARHALDENTPHRDMYVSPHHALFLDGMLIRAKDLANGRSIRRALPPGAGAIEYFNILLGAHEVILADGAPAETFLLENGNHELFANFAELERILPGAAVTAMMPFAPRLHFRGRDHLKALLRLGFNPLAQADDPIADACERLAARGRQLAV